MAVFRLLSDNKIRQACHGRRHVAGWLAEGAPLTAGGKLLWTGRKKERSSQQGDAEQAMDADDQPYEWRKQEYDQACRPPPALLQQQ